MEKKSKNIFDVISWGTLWNVHSWDTYVVDVQKKLLSHVKLIKCDGLIHEC